MRNQTIDIAKGIGILTVVICHNWILYHDRGEFSRIVFSFHMPLFFFLSGIFFKPFLSFKETVVSKANSILKPYAVITGFLIILNCLQNAINDKPLDLIKTIIRGLYASIGTLSTDNYSSGLGWVPLWFLSHLFVIYLFAWILHKLIFKRLSHAGVAIAIGVIFLVGVNNIDFFWFREFNPLGINFFLFGEHPRVIGLPFSLDLLLVTTPMFLAGYYFSSKLLGFKFNPLLLVINLIVFILSHYYFDLTMGLHDRQYDDFFITSLQMGTGIYSVIGLSSWLSTFNIPSKLFAYLGSASLFILIFHYSIQHHITGVFQYHFTNYSHLIAYLAFVASVLYSLFWYELANKFAFSKNLFYDTRKVR